MKRVAETLQVPELVVHGLLAHSHTGRELRGPQALRARVLEYEEVRLVDELKLVEGPFK